ncbi:MAG: ribbon-helix-helix protein, CopG family [Aggregatilineales bacterium]
MSRTESSFSERVGARVSPELKARLQEIVQQAGWNSEADLVREALWHYVEHRAPAPPAPPPAPAQAAAPPESPDFEGRVEWLLTVLVILVGLVSSRVLNTLRVEQVKPAELVDEAIQEAVYNRTILWTKLRAGRRAAQRFEDKRAG